MNKLAVFTISTICCAVMLTSCISGRVTSNKDPFYDGRPKSRFLFVMETGTPEIVQKMERFAIKEFGYHGLTAVPYTKAIPPVREYTDIEMSQLLKKANIQAYLRLSVSGVSKDERHIPSVSYTEGSANAVGGGGYASARGRSTTVTGGGYTQSVVTGISYDCEVQDAVSLKTIWTGYVSIDVNPQNQYAGPDDYFYKVIELLVERLQKDGVAVKAK